MRRFYLLQLLMTVMFFGAAYETYAQNIALMGPRLFVNSPSGIAGLKKFTYSSSSTDPGSRWGRELDSSWFNVDLVRSDDSLGCNQPGSSNYANKWVLIWRGTCQFGEKAKNAENKGAAGVIIINNVPGADAVGMAAGTVGNTVTIPVLMVSNPDGAAMWSTLGSSAVKISLTRWGFNYANDLAFIPNSPALGPGATPYNQWKTGSPSAYNLYTGAFVANVGTANQSAVVVKSVVTFTPTGGSASVVHTDSVTVATFNAIDSAIEALSPNSKSLNPSAVGKYTVTYTVSSSATDDNPLDNTYTYEIPVTGNIFSKSRIDANGDPILTSSTRAGGNPAPAFVWGPLFFVNDGGYKAQSVRWAINDGDTSKHSLNGVTAVAYIFKWIDGSNAGILDGIIQPKELDLKAAALRTLSTADSNSRVFTAFVGNPDGTSGNISVESNSWYWVTIDMPGTPFLGVDGDLNYYNRTNAAKYATTSVKDYWAPNYMGSKDAMLANSTDSARMIPFGFSSGLWNAHNIDSASFTGTDGTVPAVAFELSPFKVGISNTFTENKDFELFPNPATDVINVKLNLAKKADKVQIRIVDALGRSIIIDEKANLQNETVTISTSKLAAGNYYTVLIANGYASVKPFSIISK